MLKDRQNGRCSRCDHRFVFDPRVTYHKFNDVQFKRVLDAISLSGSLKFTRKQFYYFLNRRKFGTDVTLSGTVGCSIVILVALIPIVVSGAFGPNGIWLLCFYAFVFLPIVVIQSIASKELAKSHPKIKFSLSESNACLTRWEETNGLITSIMPDASRAIPLSAAVPKEVLDYSFDRLVVTQTDDIAHFLIANNFHFENNCAVLSINQFPISLFYTVMKMLRNNEGLKVYALHDASWEGLIVLDKLRNNSIWFGEQKNAQIIDIGLLPRQFEKKTPFIEDADAFTLDFASRISPGVKATLTSKEVAWLNKHVVHLESIAPQALLRMITAGIAMSRDPEKQDALVPVDVGGGGGSIDDGGLYVFSADSFG